MSIIDLYNLRSLMGIIKTMKRPRTFLRDTFFPGITEFATKAVDVDVKIGTRKLAAYVSPMAEGKVVEDEGYTTSSFAPPYVKEKKSIKPLELFAREAGATIYSAGDSPALRAARELGEKMAVLDDRFTRLEEYQCSQALDTGIVTCVGDGINATVDFQMPASHKITLSGTDLFTDSASNPGDTLIDVCDMIAQDSGLSPNRAIMGLTAWKAFSNNAAVKDKLNNRRIISGQINPQNLPNGVSFLGTYSDAGVDLDLYAYKEWYVDPVSGTEKPMVPLDKLWIGSTRARNKKLYGAIQDLKAGGLAAMARFPKSWEVDDPSVRWLLLQSAPLMGLLEPAAFASLKVV